MNEISNMDISPLIRSIDAKNFSEKIHGPGYWLVYDYRNQQVKNPLNLWGKLLGQSKHSVDYFVKTLEKPLVVNDIKFKWSEGTSDIGLDFKATFQIFVESEDQAKLLIKQLYHSEGPAKALYAIIDKHLHHEMTSFYDDTRKSNKNLLEFFYQGGADSGESVLLDNNVSLSVREQLGLSKSHFRIGFQLENAPPRQIEVEKESELNLADTRSDLNWKVNTSVMLVLNNYQRFKKSGLTNEKDIKVAVQNKIDTAVKKHLFKLQFFELIANFQESASLAKDESIQYKMEERIRSEVLAIGYDLEIFQALPDVPLLKLVDGLRVDVSSEDKDCEFKTKDSAGHVKLEVALEVKVNDFEKLKRLIPPKDIKKNMEISETIRAHVIQICRDEIQKIQRKQFNLAFDDTVKPTLTQAFEEQLGIRYGLEITVIHIIQAQTEDGERFQSLLRKEWFFHLNITPQADMGEADTLKYRGTFEVISIAEDGWEAFESKDFGFRKDSHERTSAAKNELGDLLLIDSVNEKEFELEWKNFCIRKELEAIATRIKMNLGEYFSKIESIADRTRTLEQSKEFRDQCNKIVKTIVAKDFGLEIDIKALQREDNETDLEMQGMLESDRKIRSQVLQSKVDENASHLENRGAQIKKINEVRLKKLVDDAELKNSNPEIDITKLEIDITKLDENQEMVMKNVIKKSKQSKKRNFKPLSQDIRGLKDDRDDDKS